MFGTRFANLLVWAALAGVFGTWQAVCLWRRPRLPTLGDLVRAGRARRGGPVLLTVSWLWFGWHVFVRGAW
jgi:hypothetical protein